MKETISASALAREFDIDESNVQAIAYAYRLPFSWSTGEGFFIRERDLPVWRHAIGSRRCDCEIGD
jgi:hypothetical protein